MRKDTFVKEALALHQSMTLCLSVISYSDRLKTAYFEAVRVAITRIAQGKKLSLKDINERIAELLKHTISGSDIINIFGTSEVQFSIFDPKYIDSLSRMKEKNLAVELLSRLLRDQIKVFQRTNVVQAELFSEKLHRIMNGYVNGQLNNAEVLDELRQMARDIQHHEQEGISLGLSTEEKAFYDALLKPEALKHYYEDKNQELISIVKILTDELNKNRTIDWNSKSSARSRMRSMVKRLLKKYKYPPQEIEGAVDNVLHQCELFSETFS